MLVLRDAGDDEAHGDGDDDRLQAEPRADVAADAAEQHSGREHGEDRGNESPALPVEHGHHHIGEADEARDREVQTAEQDHDCLTDGREAEQRGEHQNRLDTGDGRETLERRCANAVERGEGDHLRDR